MWYCLVNYSPTWTPVSWRQVSDWPKLHNWHKTKANIFCTFPWTVGYLFFLVYSSCASLHLSICAKRWNSFVVSKWMLLYSLSTVPDTRASMSCMTLDVLWRASLTQLSVTGPWVISSAELSCSSARPLSLLSRWLFSRRTEHRMLKSTQIVPQHKQF